MEKGLKIEGGEKLGKTIIFARNHKHAEKIVEIFNDLYPEYKGEFAKLIDNQVKYNDNLIEHFSVKNDYPQIAVSVDMLDTGVDVPEILNLVFFKPVKSKIKFWQMIGRGTRLCQNLYGVGQDKKEFYIFDYCKNFEFFSENPNGIESETQISLTERIYGYKLDLIVELQNLKYQSDNQYIEYRNELINDFLNEISKLNKESFLVKAKSNLIEQYSNKKSWNYISAVDLYDIKDNIIPLFISSEDNESAKRFDNLLYQLQIKRIKQEKTSRCENLIITIVSELEKLGTVPQIKEKQELILKVAETEYIKNCAFFDIEIVRLELRNLIQFIDPDNRKPIDIDLIDTIIGIDESEDNISSGFNFTNYRKKLEKYLAGNLENNIIWKIRHNLRLTEFEKKDLERIMFEELGSNSEYANEFGDTNIIKAVRNIVGLDREVVNDIFYKYINQNRLNMKQIQFVKLLVDYVIKNGTIDMTVLTQQPFNVVGQVYDLFGNDLSLFKEIKDDIDLINENAEQLA
jgi:type I restriction enzyme R subunit